MKSIQNKLALVTGAGSGIGRATALALAEEGSRVLVTDLVKKSADSTAEQIRSRGQWADAVHIFGRPWRGLVCVSRHPSASGTTAEGCLTLFLLTALPSSQALLFLLSRNARFAAAMPPALRRLNAHSSVGLCAGRWLLGRWD